jgi:hypothetical protein
VRGQGVVEDLPGDGEHVGADGELPRFGGVGQPGEVPVSGAGEEIAGFALGRGPRQQADGGLRIGGLRLLHQAATSWR